MDSESEFTEYSRAREESESLADPQDRVLAAYSRVWDEFYRWEPDACHEVLASLRRDTNSLHSLMEDIPPQNINHSGQDSTESDLCFISVTTGGPSTVMSIEETLAKSFAAHPPYEACTPISRNIIFREGDYDDAQECQFIPYADDPEFDSIKYLAHFAAGLAWDGFKSVHKPDIETIQLEAVRRLYLGQPSVPLHEINGCGILPKLFPDIGSGLRSGFLWETMQRDALTWPGASLSTLGALEWTRECSEFDLLSRMNAVTTHFCPNLNCVDAHCRTHTFDYPFITPKKATLNSINLFPTASNICGEDCFLNVLDYDIFKESVLWGDADIRALQAILAVTPDSSPCDLAVICRKPCNEVFVQRCLILPDETIYVPPIGDDPVESGLESDPLVFDDDDDGDARIAPIPPCSHEGPCDRRAKCPCFLSSLRCQRSCRCDLDCGRRFMGCNCRSSQPFTCESAKSCPCARVGRECDPELCMPCFSRKGRCVRGTIQSAHYASTIVKNGTYGMGLFAVETIPKNALIGEYVGDILWQHYMGHRIQIQDYRNLNYQFHLDGAVDDTEQFHIDAMRAGNCSMYVNHASGKDVNVQAECRNVNSEHRIGIFATKIIYAGKELFLDYGPNYFTDKDGGSIDQH